MKTRRILTVLLIIGSLFLLPGEKVNAQRVMHYRYVVPGGSTSSADCPGYDPCDLRYAIDVVADPGDTIIVHSGTYTSALPSEDLIFIDKSLTLWGSCEFDSTTPFICYPELQNSNLNGGNTKRVIRIEGIGIEDVSIEGFTIMQGIGTAPAPCMSTSIDGCGGGINAYNLEKLTLKNNYIWANQAGLTSGVGGGLYADMINHVLVENNTFIFNEATYQGTGWGGGALVFNSGGPHAVEFTDNLFYDNEISTENQSSNAGGSLFVYYSNNVQIAENTFKYNNSINQNSDQMGTSIFLFQNTGFFVEGNTFTQDWGTSVVSVLGSNTDYSSITRNKWWNNMVFINLDLAGIVNVDIENNFLGREMSGTLSRGGSSTLINIEGNSETERAGARIFFNTFAAANYGVDVGEYSDVYMYANIFTALTDGILLSGTTSTQTITSNLFYNNTSYTTLGSSYFYEDPMLVDLANGDFHLLPGSGAIDEVTACDFDVDIDGQHRPIGLGATPYDVGADEFMVPIYLPLVTK